MNKKRGQIVCTPEERIRRMIAFNDNGCWNWQGTKRNGYGRLIISDRGNDIRKTMTAHRYSYLNFVGEIPEGMFVCHKCDNPSCVNPEHLFVGTRQDNVDDRERKNRNNHPVGEKNGSTKLTVGDVLYIKMLLDAGLSCRKISNMYRVNKTTIQNIRNNRTWKWLSLPTAPDTDKEDGNG